LREPHTNDLDNNLTLERTTIALDAMGGDFAPVETVAGAVLAARETDVAVLLVGDPNPLQEQLDAHPGAADLPISVAPSMGVVGEGEQPARALRQKPNASIFVATKLVKEGRAGACVSMGSTGATMAAAAVILGMMEGLERPCLGGPIVGLAPRTIIIDVGTNVDCKPAQLLSFAIIGEVFANQFWHIDRPKVALLSVGSETGKGNKQVRETTELLQASGLNFVGNVEGDDLPAGIVDVVVCDGFAGNVVMKLTEGIGVSLIEHLANAVNGQVTPEAMNLIKGEILKTTNPAQDLGGGPLLGVNGVSIIGHGRADSVEVANAIATAKLALDLGFIERLTERLATVRAVVEIESES